MPCLGFHLFIYYEKYYLWHNNNHPDTVQPYQSTRVIPTNPRVSSRFSWFSFFKANASGCVRVSIALSLARTDGTCTHLVLDRRKVAQHHNSRAQPRRCRFEVPQHLPIVRVILVAGVYLHAYNRLPATARQRSHLVDTTSQETHTQARSKAYGKALMHGGHCQASPRAALLIVKLRETSTIKIKLRTP